jgi:acetyl-CoA C-acetyltransferase
VEQAHGLGTTPVLSYAMIETAVAHAAGNEPAAHRRAMAQVMDRLNAVAAGNPEAWFPTRRTDQELATPGGDNRWVSFPYTKHLCSVMDVDMAAGVVVTDARTARDLGRGPGDVAYLAGGAEATDIRIVAQRPSLADSPGITACAAGALGMAGISLDEVTAFDLYSAFPSSVELAMKAMGIGAADPRPLSLTGGLPYHGGPGNNYVSHSIAYAFRRAREGEDETVLLVGSGYFVTKHGVGIYRSRPPGKVLEPSFSVQAVVDAAASPVPVDRSAGGVGRIVGYTVPYGRDGSPAAGMVLADVGGARNVGLADARLTEWLTTVDGVGAAVHVEVGPEQNRVSAG